MGLASASFCQIARAVSQAFSPDYSSIVEC
jgi:hypothetical protein